MNDAKRTCVLCHKQLDPLDEGGELENCEDSDEARGALEPPSQAWCIVIQRENDDLVLTLRELRKELP